MSDIATLFPEAADTELAASALRKLDAALRTKGPVRLHLAGQTGGAEAPRSALAALAQVLDNFAHSEGVTVLPSHAELTTQQAADALHVSCPFLIGLLDDGQIEYRTVRMEFQRTPTPARPVTCHPKHAHGPPEELARDLAGLQPLHLEHVALLGELAQLRVELGCALVVRGVRGHLRMQFRFLLTNLVQLALDPVQVLLGRADFRA